MKLIRNLSIQSKLVLMLLAVSLASIATVGGIAYQSGKDALTKAAFDHLTSIRNSRKTQIEQFFLTTRTQVLNLAGDPRMVAAMKDFTTAYAKLKTLKTTPEVQSGVESYYRSSYFPAIAPLMGQEPDMKSFLPPTPEGMYLHYWYIAKNTNSPLERDKLDRAADNSLFNDTHGKYQPLIRKMVRDYGYGNVLLIDNATGDVVYTVNKTHIFGTSLLTGPFASFTPGKLFRTLRDSKGLNDVQIQDFIIALFAAGRPLAFMATPLREGGKQLGVLMVAVPLDAINKIMTGSNQWKSDGLGDTGEVYLVGSERLMRSAARPYMENPARYRASLSAAGYSKEEIELVSRTETTTMTQSLGKMPLEDAVNRNSKTTIMKDYLGRSALTSYAPIKVQGLDWFVVAEMAASEAFAPLTDLGSRIGIAALVMVFIVTVAAVFLGKTFVRPIFQLVDGAHRLKQHEKDVHVTVNTGDEFSDLAASFNYMSATVLELGNEAKLRTKERDEVINAILPKAAAQRLRDKVQRAYDNYEEVTILCAVFRSSAQPGSQLGVEDSLSLLSDLVNAIDDAAERCGVEKLSSHGDIYVAVCGMSRPRLDQASRIAEFAEEVLKTARWLNSDKRIILNVGIGIDTGSATGTVIGRTRFSYHLFGKPMKWAGTLAAHAKDNEVLVGDGIRAAIEGLYRFEETTFLTEEGAEFHAWRLLSDRMASNHRTTEELG
jgi:class 3 adenylate cyclase/HAMP domain-containing protein